MGHCVPGLLLLLLLLLLSGQGALGARRGRGRRELSPGLHLRGIRDAGGRYCQEQDLCCRGRTDDCALPYLGATCYCDLFCNRTVSDCCPDFWDFCLGVPPPFPPVQGCTHGGRVYPVLGTYWDNCNRCTCQETGQWECDQEPCLVDQDMINAINQGSYGWWAGNHSAFWGLTLDAGIRYRLGTLRPSSSVLNMNEVHTALGPGEALPTAFEASEKWPNLIHEPLDQGDCAGSWAFSTAAVASDRVSIHSLGHMTPVLSPQNLLSCNTHHQQGCRGGHLDGAWWFLRRRGVVSDHCYPLSGHVQGEAGPAPRCMMHSRAVGRGKRQATARCPSGHVHANDIYQVTPAYRLGSSEKEIMKELMENGPVQGGEKRRCPMGGPSSTGRQPTPGAQTGVRGATSASCVVPTSATSRASCWVSGAAWARRTWATTEARARRTWATTEARARRTWATTEARARRTWATTEARAPRGAAPPRPPGQPGPNPAGSADAAPGLGAAGRRGWRSPESSQRAGPANSGPQSPTQDHRSWNTPGLQPHYPTTPPHSVFFSRYLFFFSLL